MKWKDGVKKGVGGGDGLCKEGSGRRGTAIGMESE